MGATALKAEAEDLRQTRQPKGPLHSTSLPFSFHPQEATSPLGDVRLKEIVKLLQDQERGERRPRKVGSNPPYSPFCPLSAVPLGCRSGQAL